MKLTWEKVGEKLITKSPYKGNIEVSEADLKTYLPDIQTIVKDFFNGEEIIVLDMIGKMGQSSQTSPKDSISLGSDREVLIPDLGSHKHQTFVKIMTNGVEYLCYEHHIHLDTIFMKRSEQHLLFEKHLN